MKNTKKALLMTLCAVMLVAASVMGTMAYLTYTTDTVTNTFTVGNVKIDLDEANIDKDTITVDGKDQIPARDKANDYKLMPGHLYTKDPTIHVDAKSEDCFLFVKVTNDIKDIEDATTVADQMKAKGWDVVDATKGIYVYADAQGKPVQVAAGTDVKVFESFKIKGTVDNATLARYAGKTITVVAYAIQVDGFENSTAADIWTAVGAK